MLRLTAQTAGMIVDLVERNAMPAGAGLRIAQRDDHEALKMDLAAEPGPDDEVVVAHEAAVFLGLRLVKADTGRTCTFGDMLLRNFVMGSLVLGLIGTFTLGIGYLVDLFMIFGSRRQRLIDKMSGTLVVRV